MKKIIEIHEQKNDLPETGCVKELFGVFLDDINMNLPRHNGTLWAICGKGGSGKSSLFLSLFKSKKFLRQKFDEIHYIVRASSFNSVEKSPFSKHEHIHHDLTPGLLHAIHEQALDRKEDCLEEHNPIEHTCIIIDDFGAILKDLQIQQALKEIMNVARHANLYIIFICQTYRQMPVELRRILTHVTLFKPNREEWDLIVSEILMKKKDVADQIYDYVFDKMYNHLTINMKDGDIRKNFKLLEISE
jgi:ABC-type glutathione transport system ATPase component